MIKATKDTTTKRNKKKIRNVKIHNAPATKEKSSFTKKSEVKSPIKEKKITASVEPITEITKVSKWISTEDSDVSSIEEVPGKKRKIIDVKVAKHRTGSLSPKKRAVKVSEVNTDDVEHEIVTKTSEIPDLIEQKYPILRDEELIRRFRAVTMTNNQKGRIRQTLKEIIKGTSPLMLPDVIHNKIVGILQSTPNLTDTDLRKIRVLHNMLRISVENCKKNELAVKTSSKENDVKKPKIIKKSMGDVKQTEGPQEKKLKKTQRYVVFVGNLPVGVNKNMLMEHFNELKLFIKDVRIPPRKEDMGKSIAYIELANAASYEMALSKHHTMLGNKRINVLYTAHKKSKLSKADIKSKSAKMAALVKSGQLAGSIGVHRKRNQRRAKMRRAQKEDQNKNVQIHIKKL